jgi:hypothetical protein
MIYSLIKINNLQIMKTSQFFAQANRVPAKQRTPKKLYNIWHMWLAQPGTQLNAIN